MKALLFLSLLCVITVGLTNGQLNLLTTCPDEKTLRPCKCETFCDECVVVFVCDNIKCLHQLHGVDVLTNESFLFNAAVFNNSRLAAIPTKILEAETFGKLVVHNSYLYNLTSGNFSGKTQLQEIWFKNMRIHDGFQFQCLHPFKALKRLVIEEVVIDKVPNNLTDYLPSDMIVIILSKTRTLKIGLNAFSNFSKLDSLSIEQGLIKSVSGSMFPNSLRVLSLSGNKIKSLPAGFMGDLPNLTSINLRDNQLAFLEESMFGNAPKLSYIDVHGNPIICDCKLHWLVNKKKIHIEGQCKELQDKRISDLTEDDLLHC